MELKYITILYIFVEWVILLHDCYSLWARPMWRFIMATRTTTCTAAQPHDRIKGCHLEKGGKKSLRVDLKIVMDRLGIRWDHNDHRHVITGSEDLLGLFDEDEPSLDEVKEAFSVFDRKKDGYIDEKELQYALSEMACQRISGSDCRRMIDRYDADKDGKISFREFLKLMEDCFL
ncbi:putative EF-hand domain-containing protein [Helianthus debilis subsp. tardiflorus]